MQLFPKNVTNYFNFFTFFKHSLIPTFNLLNNLQMFLYEFLISY
jgi:hypothetical protein